MTGGTKQWQKMNVHDGTSVKGDAHMGREAFQTEHRGAAEGVLGNGVSGLKNKKEPYIFHAGGNTSHVTKI